MKVRKISALLLVLALVAAAITALVNAEEPAASVLPPDINGETKFATGKVLSFDEEGIADSITPNGADRCSFEIADGVGISGKALKMTSGSNTCEVNITLGEQDWSLYDGLLYYVDVSGVTLSADKTTTGTGIRIHSLYSTGYSWTRNTVEPIIPDFEINAYYREGDQWKLCDQSLMNGERVQFPQGYKGWVYVPFDSYISTKGSNQTTEQGVYGAECIAKIMLLSGPYQYNNTTGVVIFDEINLVKLGMTDEEFAASTAESESESQTEASNETNKPAETKAPADSTTDKAPEQSSADATESTGDSGEKSGKGCKSSIVVPTLVVAAVSLSGAAVLVNSEKRRKR
ncbi:MAG: hypothetical protein ACI3XQ_01735 [Eubacteriales bacterium]